MRLAVCALVGALLLTLGLAASATAVEHLCANYSFQEDAQANIARFPGTLDPDGDGVACPELPSRGAAAAPAPAPAAAPAPVALPDTGTGTTAVAAAGTFLLPLLASLLAVVGLMAVRPRPRA